MKKVSVVIPAYNAGTFLAETIDSVLAQTYPHVEVVVIDDGSKDDTPDVLARYGDRIVSKRQPNGGLPAARNAGMALATGHYVAWVDADDLCAPERIALQVAFLEAHPECSVVASDFSAFDATGWTEASHAAAYYTLLRKRGLAALFPEQTTVSVAGLPPVTAYFGQVREALVHGNFLHPPTLMMTRAAADEVGRLDARFGNDGADYDYVLRLAHVGTVAFLDAPLLRYRYSDHQLSSDKNMARMARSLVAVLENLADTEPARRRDPVFRRRMAEAYLRAAKAMAEDAKGPAVRNLAQSIRTAGFVDADAAARTALKLLLPRRLLGTLRALRARA